MSEHQEVVNLLMKAVETHPIGTVLEATLTLVGKLGANMREAGLVSDRSMMLAFTDAMHLAFEPAEAPTPRIRLYRPQETRQ